MLSEDSLRSIESGSETDLTNVLEAFNSENAQTFSFPNVTTDFKQKCVQTITGRLKGALSSKCQILCLQALRIYSREKERMEVLTSDDTLELLVKLSGLQYYAEEEGEGVTIQDGDQDVMVESQKCLCNLIFNSTVAQRYCRERRRVSELKDQDVGLCGEILKDPVQPALAAEKKRQMGPKIRYELHGFTYLMEVLDLTLRAAEEKRTGLGDQDVDLCSEILKILFNLTVAVEKKSADEEEEAHFMRLVSVLRDLLMCTTISKDKQEELHSHTVNLLINIPVDFYEELLTPLNESDVRGVENKDVEYDGKNMEAIIVLIEFLSKRLDRPSKSLKESLTPILHCLCEACRHNRSIRKFCRTKILPPLREEVKRLPEEGDSLRNRLCKQLTSPVTEVKDLVAHFMFVLCKENVNRMVKYTGYGNCAGLLAQFGLLKLEQGNTKGDYSSDSEDSDTEEYSELKDQINLVTGRWEESKPDPMEGMSEEQKEHEAMKLVDAMDKLHRQGLIQPSRIGPDGSPVPVPVSHILELAESGGATAAKETDSD
ncbi:synembryn-A-like [Haliotis rubra]|uniref:synembryn-A-like n=1 Tax=Haliotis rubra TaxID=36100 RepID=UPI001EE5481F|nr:synembryn-A-like [Haliotis rubra]